MSMIDDYLEDISKVGGIRIGGIHKDIEKFFRDRKQTPIDSEISELASSFGVTRNELDCHIYIILHHFIRKEPGRHKDIPDSHFIPGELKLGSEIEYEHTDCQTTAKEIAKDHLYECKNYYSRLLKMEENCKKQKEE